MNDEEYQDDSFSDLSGNDSEEINEEHEIDPAYLEYLQNSFQDEIVCHLFNNIREYVKNCAIPICEYLTQEDIEIIIQELAE